MTATTSSPASTRSDGAPAAGTFWSTCARLIDAYPGRPRALTQAAEPYALRDQLEEQGAALCAALAPGPWRVDASVGRSAWAALPWVAFLDPRHTTTVRHGVYVVAQVLWQAPHALRLGLTVALGDANDRPAGRAAEVAHDLASTGELDGLSARGFVAPTPWKPGDDDDHDGWLARSFARGLIVQKQVPLAALRAPASRGELDDDLRALLAAYRRWVELHAGEPVAPDPDRPLPDLRHALDALTAAAARRALSVPRELLESLLLSLKTNRLLVLAGGPGCGKSTLVRLLADVGARVEAVARLDPGDLERRAAAAEHDPRRQHVLLLEEPPRRETEGALAAWLPGAERRLDGLTVVWTTSSPGRAPSRRLLDQANVLRLTPPSSDALGAPPESVGSPGEVPGVLEPALLRRPPGTRPPIEEATPAARAARAVLAEVLGPTQDALTRFRAPVRLSWRTREDVFAYVLAALEADLGHGTLRRATDQQLRQRVLPLLLTTGTRLPPRLVDELARTWSAVTNGPTSAAGLLRAAAEQETTSGRAASFWSLLD